MHKGRLEAFSDGVIAILITIMVLELKAPEHADWHALHELWPVFLSYLLSFLYVGIYWNNHHHLLQAAKHVDGRVLWANLHLLFWLSLIPFVTSWMGDNHFAARPVALYGVVLLFSAIAYFLLTLSLVAVNGRDSVIAQAMGRDIKGKASLLLYVAGLLLTLVSPWIGCAVYVLVALIWLVPDRRIEKKLAT